MKKIGIITFHMAHNYGSMLQAWALQETLKLLGYEVEIIDYRNQEIINQYRLFPKIRKWKNLIRNLIYIFYYPSLKKKQEKFLSFASDFFQLGNRYNSLEEIQKNPPEYSVYITGSDQVWNFSSGHTDDAYFLSFVQKGDRISYATSFGPLDLTDQKLYYRKIKTYLPLFKAISVREENSAKIIQNVLGITPPITLDPTLLLERQAYEKLIQHITPPEGKYIFFYTLNPTKPMIRLVKKISSILGYRVIITKFNNEIDLLTPFEKYLASGPLEFLCILKNASLVLTSSYHATVFSIKFERPFFAINGMSDHRISSLLKTTQLTNYSLNNNNVNNILNLLNEIDFSKSSQSLSNQSAISISFLKTFL